MSCLVGVLVSVSGTLAATAGEPARTPARPNVLLITVDTLRPDALGWVAGHDATPQIDALAAEGFRFPDALSPVPITLPAHTSLLTGLLPRRHGVRDNGQTVPSDGLPTLAERLSGAGWTTAAFVSGYPLAAAFGLARGFDHYDDRFGGSESAGAAPLERSAAATVEAAAEWLAEAPQPWLLWVHFYDPHDPYDPPPELRRDGPRGGYDGEVAAVDRAIGRLRKTAGTQGPLLTVLTADHGESLGEHGEQTHGFFIYQSTLAVPLVFHYPGRVRAAQSPQRARLIDVAPTVLDLLQLPALDGVDGVSLRPLLEGREQRIPAAYLESRRPWISYGWAPLAAVVEDGWKLIAAPKPELYELRADPAETENRVDSERRRARRLQAELRRVEARPAMTASGQDDPEALARLRSLGYLGAGTRRGEPPAGLPDPKERIDLWNLLGQAEALFERRRFDRAVERYDAVLASEPANRFAWARSGMALLEAGRPEAAVARLEKAVAADPDQPETRRALAQALDRLGRYPQAVTQWMEAARLQPGRVDAWTGLGGSLGLSGQVPRAVEAYRKAVELTPEDPRLQTRLAFALHAAGDVEAAVAGLEHAARLTGADRFGHSGALGLLLLRLGRAEQARPWLQRSRPGEPEQALARYELSRLLAADGDLAAARRALGDALASDPALRQRATGDPVLQEVLSGP